jgi:hypothetical protein
LYSFFKNPQLLWVQFNAPFFQKKIGKSIKKLLTNTLARFIDVEPLQKDNSILPDVLIAFLSMPLYSAPSFLV